MDSRYLRISRVSATKKKTADPRQAVGRYFIFLDKRCARLSSEIVVISEDFCDVLTGWGIDSQRIHVIHNWAPLEDCHSGPAITIGLDNSSLATACVSCIPVRSR